jgi:hypothetical protein
MSDRNKAMGGHQSATPITTTWLTPPPIIAALGGADSFDLDPCGLKDSHIPTARHVHALPEVDGLAAEWWGRVWLNPPYTASEIGDWLRKLADHGRGAALIFARTETAAFHRQVWARASGLLFLEGRLNFHYPEAADPEHCKTHPHVWEIKSLATKAEGCKNCGMAKANAGAPSVLCAYGHEDLDRLAASDLAGALVPLQFPRFAVVAAMSATWRDVVLAYMRRQSGPVVLADLYRDFAKHPKARENRHWQAKVRQVLQLGPFERVGRGEWVAA